MKYFFIRIILGLRSFIKNPSLLLLSIRQWRSTELLENDEHISIAIDWLLKAQVACVGDGFSRGFYLHRGWDKSYIETTGYIIPTLLRCGHEIGREDCLLSARKAGEWLAQEQLRSGAYTDIDRGVPLVFDTGQVLYGLNALYESGEIRYGENIVKASDWLCNQQDLNGSWTACGFNSLPHSYYTRVAFALAQSGKLLNNKIYLDVAKKNIDWAISQQSENGFFKYLPMSKGQSPLLHSMIYVLEGLLEYYQLTGYQPAYRALLENAERLKGINVTRDIILFSQYNEDWSIASGERCMTGLAQWSGLCLKLHKLTNDHEYLLCARKTLTFLKSKQLKEGVHIKGAFSGSLPIWGEYCPFAFNNWQVKFFLDALLDYKPHVLSIIDESRKWIEECFRFSPEKVNSSFSFVGDRFASYLENELKPNTFVLDIGCGEGKYIKRLRKKGINVYGVDPCFELDDIVSRGDSYETNQSDNSQDVVYLVEVLQHVQFVDVALREIRRVLRPGGCLIIADRTPCSVWGILKPIWEFRGKWMYPFDSPFNEKWYTLRQWKEILKRNSFEVKDSHGFTSRSPRLLGLFGRYQIIKAYIES